jgi:hypothetical protein
LNGNTWAGCPNIQSMTRREPEAFSGTSMAKGMPKNMARLAYASHP